MYNFIVGIYSKHFRIASILGKQAYWPWDQIVALLYEMLKQVLMASTC